MSFCRADDNVESFKKRIATYTSSTVLVLEEFKTRGLLRKVDANGSPDQVWDLTRQLFLVRIISYLQRCYKLNAAVRLGVLGAYGVRPCTNICRTCLSA